MKDNVYLIKRINEMRKEEHEYRKQIEVLERAKHGGMPGMGNEEGGFQNEQRKEMELMDMTIARCREELALTEQENEQLRMRRPPRTLAPIQGNPGMIDMDGNNQQQEIAY